MKENKVQRKVKMGIRAKILVGMIVCVLIVSNLMGGLFIFSKFVVRAM